MSIEGNKALIHRYFETFSTCAADVADLLHEDVTWWVPRSSPLGGTHVGKAAVLELLGAGVDFYAADVPMRIEIEQLVAEGDRVSAQVVIRAESARGEPYENHYHFAFRVRADKIVAVREYVDTLYAMRKLAPAR